ncbi:MAG: polysaccharide lyase family 7 protein [Candidatus Levybacteria bacterium]|nr:polysaccharide lyase family 7 protein [Candidatus Levybacteria bacterium]
MTGLFLAFLIVISVASFLQSKSSAATVYPSQIINLTNWKLTLPIGKNEKPIEIKQPDLAKFEIDPWFVATLNGNGVRFRSPVNGMTTKGSNYPRSELREMTGSGVSNASWNSTSGVHSMFLDEAITALPSKKKHIVAGQIHDAKSDVIVIRLQDRSLFINVDGENVKTLDSNYILGKRFSVKFVVKNGQTAVFYNGSSSPVYTLNKEYSGAYFKAGAYTQSNCSKEESLKCTDTNYGEVIIFKLTVTHQ